MLRDEIEAQTRRLRAMAADERKRRTELERRSARHLSALDGRLAAIDARLGLARGRQAA